MLGAPELFRLQASGVSRLLDAAGVEHRTFTSAFDLSIVRVGALSRSGATDTASAPLVRVTPPAASEPDPLQPIAAFVLTIAAAAALALARRIPPFVKAAVVIGGLAWSATLAYAAWWSLLPPVDVASVTVDWRTSAAAPIIAVLLVYAWDIYPAPGGFVVKTAGLVLVAAAVGGFSIVRLAVVAAGYDAFGTPGFLGLFLAAGTFWDLVPGLSAVALVHALLRLPTAAELIASRLPGLSRG